MKQALFAPDHQQPNLFSFVQENELKARKIIEKYPPGRQASALVPLLDLAQRQNNNWLSKSAIRYVANLLNVAETRAFEVATFYSMFRLTPCGKFLIQLCRTTPCWLRGSDGLQETCKRTLDLDIGDTTKDNMFTVVEVECLGACVNAPVIQINDDYYEDMTDQKLISVLEGLRCNKDATSDTSKASPTLHSFHRDHEK